jgi:hypothetical protein
MPIEKKIDPIKVVSAADVDPGFITVKLLRPNDLLSVELRFKNFELQGNTLVKKADPALMMVVFQSQSIAESCGTEDTTAITPPALPAKLLLSGNSRLVFKVNKPTLSITADDLLNWDDFEMVVNSRAKGIDRIIIRKPFNPKDKIDILLSGFGRTSALEVKDLKGITKDEKILLKQKLLEFDIKETSNTLTTNNAQQSLSGSQIPVPQGPIPKIPPIKIPDPTGPVITIPLLIDPVAPPDEWETSLEIPLRLFLSPTKGAGWKHLIKLGDTKGIIKETDKLYELWHTRMGTKTVKGIDDSDLTEEERLLRVLWGEKINKDYTKIPTATNDAILGNTSINDFYRHQVVHESSNFSIKNFTPQPVTAKKLFLTTLGAWLDSIFVVEVSKLIPAANPLSVLKWRHIQTLAREHYVELVLAGNIMPFGHQAVKITITERKPHKPTTTATNFKREIVLITQPVKDYNYRDSSNTFMQFCFSKIEILNPASPLLDVAKKALVDPSKISDQEQFIIRSGNKDVQFKMHAEDLNGNIVNFQMPLVFVSNTVLSKPGSLNDLIAAYNSSIFNWATNFNGQNVSLAPIEQNSCDTAYAAYDATFKVKSYSANGELQGFLPILVETKIIEPSYQRLTGSNTTVPAAMEDDNNKGHVFARFNFSQPINFAGNADKTGGFAMPNFNLSGLSKAAGAFGGKIDDFKNAAATAASYFTVNSMPDPVLFGVFKLSEILEFAKGDTDSYDLAKPLSAKTPKIPNLTTEQTADEIITSYVVNANVIAWPDPASAVGKIVNLKPDVTTDCFSVVTKAVVNKKTLKAPVFSADAKMKAFSINFFGDLISVKFLQIHFTTSPGKSADVNIDMDNPCIKFGGPLSFINAFQKLIPPGGFSDPPYLDVSTTGVKCGYTLALPNLQLGVFTLSNMGLGAEVNLPFTGAPLTMAFRFCEKQQPFTLTVSILGGGGYFGLEVDLHGLRQIDAALEFGAAVALNLGVASGSVSIMAGIYFKLTMTDGENSTQLTGYLRINGAMSILGLISAAIELYMAFTYLIDQHKVYGEASVSIKVHVLFFSKTVSVHTSRTFAGSGSDPNFQMTYSPDKWREYCEAFAA